MIFRSTTMKRSTTAIVVAAAAAAWGGCGNYSNEDVEYQLALPEQNELEAKLPQALTVEDSAEYYRTTRDTVFFFNGILDSLLGLVEHVRRHPATKREVGKRIWGPFQGDKPGWTMMITMERVPKTGVAERFDYSFEVRPSGDPTAAWIPLLWGSYLPSGGVRRGTGVLDLNVVDAINA